MKYPYIVNCGGVWYSAGTEVPAVNNQAPQKQIEKISEEKTAHQFSRSEIQKLSTAELKELAIKEGIVDAEKTSGSQLKKILIEHFEL